MQETDCDRDMDVDVTEAASVIPFNVWRPCIFFFSWMSSITGEIIL